MINQTTATLLAHLQSAYPNLGFDLSDKESCGCHDFERAPQALITFTGPYELCITDPLSEVDGFGPCEDTVATYGISRAEAEAIRRHNRVELFEGPQ